jgi:hypothetical protein
MLQSPSRSSTQQDEISVPAVPSSPWPVSCPTDALVGGAVGDFGPKPTVFQQGPSLARRSIETV